MIIVHILTMISESLILKPTCFYLYVLMVACYELMILCLYICKLLFLYSFLGKDTYYVKKFQTGFSDEIVRNIGGKSKNNLKKNLNNFTDTDFEIDTFIESPYFDIDSLREQLTPHTKKLSVFSVHKRV